MAARAQHGAPLSLSAAVCRRAATGRLPGEGRRARAHARGAPMWCAGVAQPCASYTRSGGVRPHHNSRGRSSLSIETWLRARLSGPVICRAVLMLRAVTDLYTLLHLCSLPCDRTQLATTINVSRVELPRQPYASLSRLYVLPTRSRGRVSRRELQLVPVRSLFGWLFHVCCSSTRIYSHSTNDGAVAVEDGVRWPHWMMYVKRA
jgi:hypothetical protein